MLNDRARLITYKDHPPELAVIKSDNPADALLQVESILLDKNSPAKGVMWQLEDGQFDAELSCSLSDKFAAIASAGLNVAAAGKDTELGNRTECSIRRQRDPLPLTMPKDSPFALKLLPALYALKGVSLKKLYVFEKDSDLPFIPHFDEQIAREFRSMSKWEKRAENVKEWFERKTFMQGKSIRIVWNEANVSDEEQRIGTLFWSKGQVPEFESNAEYLGMLRAGNLDGAMDVVRRKFPLKLADAWQAPNRSIMFLHNGEQSSAFDLLPHSVMPKSKQSKADVPWSMHRIEI